MLIYYYPSCWREVLLQRRRIKREPKMTRLNLKDNLPKLESVLVRYIICRLRNLKIPVICPVNTGEIGH